MKQSNSLIFVNPITTVYIFLALLCNQFQTIFLGYFIGFIHEMSHVFFAKLFSVKVNKIEFLPFGFYAEMVGLDKKSVLKQIIIIAAGPLSFFVSNLIGFLLFKNNVISIYGFSNFQDLNRVILIFNLLPFYPLDGGRIINILISLFFDYKNVLKFRIALNGISILTLAFVFSTQGQWLVLSFLIFNFISQIKKVNKDYYKFLVLRLNLNNKYKIKINNSPKIVPLRNNYLVYQQKIMDENGIIQILINKNRKKFLNEEKWVEN